MRVQSFRSLIYLFLAASLGWAQASPSDDQNPPDQQAAPAAAPEATPAASPAAPAPTPPPPPNVFSSSSVRLGGIDFSGYVDGYYTFNDNHPVDGLNGLYNFNDHTDVDLNMAKLTASLDGTVGFRVDVGGGRAFQLIHTPLPDPAAFRNIEQAYISLKPKGWKGVEIDFGDFVTSAGAEVIESKDNWNYSRSLLFSLAVPYYHFGIRSSVPIGSSLTVGVQIVNGWNAIVDQHGNNMQTVGIVSALTRKKYTWSNNFYVGQQWTPSLNLSGNRNLYDTTLLLTPTDKFNVYINYDYGVQHAPAFAAYHWTGVALAAHFQLTKRIAVSPRAEYFNDSSGLETGTVQKVHEITITGEYKLLDGLLARAEFRHDGSNVPYFTHGLQTGVSQTQTTATLGVMAFFPVKH